MPPRVMKNYYEVIGKGIEYYNPDFYAPRHPSNSLILGKTGTGKTNILLNLISQSKNFTNVFLFTGSSPDEPLYDLLEEKLGDKYQASSLEGFEAFLDELKDTKHAQNLVIIDDFILKKKFCDKLTHFLTYARKANVGGTSVILLAQSFFEVPKTSRLQVQYFFIMPCISRQEIKRIMGSCTVGDLDADAIFELYSDATADKEITDFFLIDCKTKHDNLRYRVGLDDCIIINTGKKEPQDFSEIIKKHEEEQEKIKRRKEELLDDEDEDEIEKRKLDEILKKNLEGHSMKTKKILM